MDLEVLRFECALAGIVFCNIDLINNDLLQDTDTRLLQQLGFLNATKQSVLARRGASGALLPK